MTYAVPEARRRRGRPPQISRERIVEAAFELGFENLTMAAVAARLGVTHQSLYGWVRDRDELIDLMSDQLIAGIEIKQPGDSRAWREWLRSVAYSLWDLACRHPGFAAAGLVRYRTSPAYLDLNNRVVRLLSDADLEPSVGQQVYEAVTTVTLGLLAREEALRPLRSDPAAAVRALDVAAAEGSIAPATAAAAASDLSLASLERRRFVIDALLAGLPDGAAGDLANKRDELVDIREPVRSGPR